MFLEEINTQGKLLGGGDDWVSLIMVAIARVHTSSLFTWRWGTPDR